MTANGQVIKLEGEYEQLTDSNESITRRIKEMDRVTVPKFPTLASLKQWHSQLIRNLVLASGRTDHVELRWLDEILKVGAKFEDFHNSGGARFATLDIKLHCAMTQVIKDGCRTLAAKLSTLEDEAMAKGMLLKGRQLVWLVHDWFRLNPEMQQVYGLQAITDLEWYGDNNISAFVDMWKLVTTNNSIVLTEPQKAELLVQKMAPSKVLAQDIAYWRRLPHGNEQRTHDYLITSMLRYLDRTHMDKNVEAQRRLVAPPGGKAPTAAATGGDSAAGGKRPCYFFNHGSCKNTDAQCKFSHVKVSADEKAKMVKPERRERERSPSPAGGRKTAEGGLGHCFKFLKGECKNGDSCMFSHIDQVEVDRQKMAKAEAKAKAKAKAEPKAKAKAKAAPANAVSGAHLMVPPPPMAVPFVRVGRLRSE